MTKVLRPNDGLLGDRDQQYMAKKRAAVKLERGRVELTFVIDFGGRPQIAFSSPAAASLHRIVDTPPKLAIKESG
jgi:hypothetical protein